MANAREGFLGISISCMKLTRKRIPTTTLREFTMLHIMNSLTDKHGWEEKVGDVFHKILTLSRPWSQPFTTFFCSFCFSLLNFARN